MVDENKVATLSPCGLRHSKRPSWHLAANNDFLLGCSCAAPSFGSARQGGTVPGAVYKDEFDLARSVSPLNTFGSQESSANSEDICRKFETGGKVLS